MLSYRHGFHAGNHADVVKHFILVQLLAHLLQKDKALWYVDTHAGAAQYALNDSTALKNSEFETGIGRLWGRRGLPSALEAYVAQVRLFNPDPHKLKAYPGSPQIALQMLRPQDRLRLFEKHSSEIRILQQNVAAQGRRAIAVAGDGFDALKSVLPPPSRRALVLIDPSYEDKSDYKRTKQALVDALTRFATGTYAIWYPQVQRRESRQLPNSLKLAGAEEWLHVSLTVKAPATDGYGLHGSGMFIVNPPWTLADSLRQAMPWLVDALAQDQEATFLLETR
jgi:23S rRNA (adenine2030-N6)-methyltransferase